MRRFSSYDLSGKWTRAFPIRYPTRRIEIKNNSQSARFRASADVDIAMRDFVTLFILLLIVGAEGALWVENPMHVPAAFMPARATGLQLFHEMDSSMKPAISPGQYVLVSAWSYWRHEPQAGDVVAFQYPLNPALADVKRVVAVGGSTVEVVSGITYVDGKRDSSLHSRRAAGGRDMPVMRVPLGSYFVLGDDPDSSDDSRDYGVIKRDRIIGEAVWPRQLAPHAQGRTNPTLAAR